jgi:hypothetical protein
LASIVRVENQQQQQHGHNNRFVSTWLPVDVVKEMDKRKGDISRNLYIKRAVFKALKEERKQNEK